MLISAATEWYAVLFVLKTKPETILCSTQYWIILKMVYPEEPFWVLPTVTGFYEDRDYRGKFDLCLFFIY